MTISNLSILHLSRIFVRNSLGLVWCLVIYSNVHAQQWTLETIDGRTIRVDRIELDATGQVKSSNISGQLHLSDLYRVDSGRAVQASAGSVEIMLAGGGRLHAASVWLDGEQLAFDGSELTGPLPVESVNGLVWQPHDRISRALAQPLGDSDQLIVAADEAPVVVVGVVQSLTSTGVVIQYQNRELEFPLDRLMGIVWADISRAATGSHRATVRTMGGNQVGGYVTAWSGENLTIQTTAGYEVSIPVERISSIDFQSDRLAFLSDWQPTNVEQKSWFAPPRDWRRNLNVAGEPITLFDPSTGKRLVFARGIGVQAYTRLVYSNDSMFDRLLATVGIDASTMGRGDCEMSVVGDGVRLWEARVRGNDPPLPIDVDIRGVRQLELVVEPGQQFDLSDHANWADIRLLKSR